MCIHDCPLGDNNELLTLAIIQLMQPQVLWGGTTAQLLAALSSSCDGMPERELPQTAEQLSSALWHLEPHLLQAGVTVQFLPKDNVNGEQMVILSKEIGGKPLPLASASGSYDWVPITRLIDRFLATCRYHSEDDLPE